MKHKRFGIRMHQLIPLDTLLTSSVLGDGQRAHGITLDNNATHSDKITGVEGHCHK